MAFLSPDIAPGSPIGFLLFSFSTTWTWLLGSLAILLLVTGIDDLVPLFICFRRHLRRDRDSAELPSVLPKPERERKIAIFVPCWKESAVIGNMIRHNLAAIRYRNFDFFLGVYPNDEATVSVAQELAGSFKNVHVAICPHPGPTSKADCLNWAWQRMLAWEQEQQTHFDTIVLHDAEDLIHPEALPLINRERARYAMVQVPVLPLPGRFHEFTYGVYCDEFAEFQTIDMPARQFSRSFIPSNGVGTGFAREILERLSEERETCIFDAGSLTEDYEIGVYIHKCGYSQLFAPLRRTDKEFIATREYFPSKIHSAIRQRTRWITGIALQCWEREGWRGAWRTRYWFWRDRKGLIANPLSLLTNLLFVAGTADWIEAAVQHRPWAFAVTNPGIVELCSLTLALQCLRVWLRMMCVARIFGVPFALGVPLRILHGNFINCFASLRAVWGYTHARIRRTHLVWLKTDHAYPEHATLQSHRRELADVLVRSGYLTESELSKVQAGMPEGADLADFLLTTGVMSDEDLCQAMSLQSGLPSTRIDARRVRPRVVRTLPVHVQQRFGIVPFRVHGGRLLVAGTRPPASEALEALKGFTQLPVEFQLVTQENYEALKNLM